MKTVLFIPLLILSLSNIGFTQEVQEVPPVEGVQPLTWSDFQKTQNEILEQQRNILGTLFEIREQTRQININFLSWQTARQDVLKAIGDNRGCNIWQYKYDPRSELVTMGLAIWAVFLTGYMVLSWFANLFRKKEVK